MESHKESGERVSGKSSVQDAVKALYPAKGLGFEKPRVVVVIFRPDGRTIVNQVDTEVEVPEDLGKNMGRLVSSLDFKAAPKRYEVLLEKWGKTKGNAGEPEDRKNEGGRHD
jgi:hypothetical protein